MIVANNDVVFNAEKRTQHAYTISLSSDRPGIDESNLSKRRPSSLFAPPLLDMFKNIMSSPISTELDGVHLDEESSIDNDHLFQPMELSSSTTAALDQSLDVIDIPIPITSKESSLRTNRERYTFIFI